MSDGGIAGVHWRNDDLKVGGIDTLSREETRAGGLIRAIVEANQGKLRDRIGKNGCGRKKKITEDQQVGRMSRIAAPR